MEDAVSGRMALALSALETGLILLENHSSPHSVIDRARVAMINAAWATLLSAGEPVNDHDDVIPALRRRFGNNSKYYGFITGAEDVCRRFEFGPPITDTSSLEANAQRSVRNARVFLEAAAEFISTRDEHWWQVY
jgi:uncharacterized protein (UPF0332 family)